MSHRSNLMIALAAMCLGGILPETSDVPAKPEEREPRKPRDKSNIDDAIAVIEVDGPTPKSEYERNAEAIREETQRRKTINFRKRLPKGHPDRIES